jgi:Rrf2 family protein
MRLTTRTRYAVRSMIDIALAQADRPITRDEIAERQEISPLYLSHILLRLGKAGLISSAKGPGGGYRLLRSPEEIRIADIVRAVGEPIDLVWCTGRERKRQCERIDTCAAHLLWVRLAECVRQTLESVTLAQLCDEAKRLMAEKEKASQAET